MRFGTVALETPVTPRAQLLKNFFDASVDLFCIASLEGYFLHLNHAFKKVLGYEIEELQEVPFLDFVHPDDQAATLAEMEKLSGGAVTLYFENRYRCKDGTYKWLGWTSMPIPDEGVTYATARDVTRQKAEDEEAVWVRQALEEQVEKHRGDLSNAEANLSETEKVLRLFVENTPTAVAMFDREMHYLLVSDRWVQDYELEGRQLIGKSHYEIFPEIPERWREIHRRCLNGATEKCDEEEFARAGGRSDWVRWEVHPWFNRHGQIGGIIIFTEVVTEKKRLQEQLQQSQRLDAVGKLAGGIAHDFNNLLTVIQGRAQLALSALRDSLDPRHEVEVIAKAAERAAALTGQLLAFSRQRPPKAELLQINASLAELEKMWYRLLGENIDLKTIPNPDLWPVFADRSQVEQVLMNLVINARDAMPNGGRLTIETSNVRLDEEYARKHLDIAPGPYVLIAVSDTGIGMDDATRQRMFDPFFTTKEAGKGTGLGLSTVYGIVRQNGGNIWVYSEPGQGTTFKIYFPRAAKAEAGEEEDPFLEEAPRSHGAETILLVEDEEAVRDLAREVLEAAGYKVIDAPNGMRAAQVIKGYDAPVHLLVTDMVMPEMGGSELAAWLLSDHPALKVLYMSGYTEYGAHQSGHLKAGVHYLQKPFTPDLLQRKVREVLDG